MKRAILVALGTGTIITSATAIGIGAALSHSAHSMDPLHYQAALRGVEAAREHAVRSCDPLDGANRELCQSQAASHHLVRAAELEADYRRDQAAARALQRARIDARYQVERARCFTQAGYRRDRCLIAAHADRGRAMLEAAAPYEARF